MKEQKDIGEILPIKVFINLESGNLNISNSNSPPNIEKQRKEVEQIRKILEKAWHKFLKEYISSDPKNLPTIESYENLHARGFIQASPAPTLRIFGRKGLGVSALISAKIIQDHLRGYIGFVLGERSLEDYLAANLGRYLQIHELHLKRKTSPHTTPLPQNLQLIEQIANMLEINEKSFIEANSWLRSLEDSSEIPDSSLTETQCWLDSVTKNLQSNLQIFRERSKNHQEEFNKRITELPELEPRIQQ